MEQFICPITKEIMTDPVIAMDGYTYERSAIQKWLEQHSTSPMTNTIIEKLFVVNYNIRSTMAACGHPLKSISGTVYIISDRTENDNILLTIIEEELKKQRRYIYASCSTSIIFTNILTILLIKSKYMNITLKHNPIPFCLSATVFGILYANLFYKVCRINDNYRYNQITGQLSSVHLF